MNKHEEQFFYYYLEQTAEEMRHIENLRERVTIMVITLASAIGGFIIQQKYAAESKLLAWFIVILGVFGLTMVAKLYQIHQRLQYRLNYWYDYYAQLFSTDTQFLMLRDRADDENKKKFRLLAKIKHNYFWALLHIFIILGGCLLLMTYNKVEVKATQKPVPVSDSVEVIKKPAVHHPPDTFKSASH